MAAACKTGDVLSSGSLQSTLLVVMAIQTCSGTPYLICPDVTTPVSTANLNCTTDGNVTSIITEGNVTTNFIESPDGALATVCLLYNGTCTAQGNFSAYVTNTSVVTLHTPTYGGYWLCVEAQDSCYIPVEEPPADHTTIIAVGIIVGVVMVTAVLVFCRIKRAISQYSHTAKSFDSTATV